MILFYKLIIGEEKDYNPRILQQLTEKASKCGRSSKLDNESYFEKSKIKIKQKKNEID